MSEIVTRAAASVWRPLVRAITWTNSHPAAAGLYLSVAVAILGGYKVFLENHVSVQIEGRFTRFRGDRESMKPLPVPPPVRMRILFSNRGLLATTITRLQLVSKGGTPLPETPNSILMRMLHDPISSFGDTPFVIPARSSVANVIDLGIEAVRLDEIGGLLAVDIDGRVHHVQWEPSITVDMRREPAPADAGTKAPP